MGHEDKAEVTPFFREQFQYLGPSQIIISSVGLTRIIIFLRRMVTYGWTASLSGSYIK